MRIFISQKRLPKRLGSETAAPKCKGRGRNVRVELALLEKGRRQLATRAQPLACTTVRDGPRELKANPLGLCAASTYLAACRSPTDVRSTDREREARDARGAGSSAD